MEFRLPPKDIEDAVKEYAAEKIASIYQTFDRQEREVIEDKVTAEIMEHFAEIYPDNLNYVADVVYSMKKEYVRSRIINEQIRPDGRGLTDIRDIWCEVGLLPRVHGSAVFTRGQTQALTTVTLGTISEVQKLEGLDEDFFKRYMHHYNMPPYSTGEARPMRSPGREIGHGALAERALEPVLPTEEFSYAIRTVSEILSSNGPPLKQAYAAHSRLWTPRSHKSARGCIAMGLIKDEEKKKMPFERHSRAGGFLRRHGLRSGNQGRNYAIQMDIKIKGIDEEILRVALEQQDKAGCIYSTKCEVLPSPENISANTLLNH